MNFTNALIEKAKTAKSAEELLAMAKAENIDMTAEKAAKAFAELHKTGELSDNELDNVAGGNDSSCNASTPFTVGTKVYIEMLKRYGIVEEVGYDECGMFSYKVRISYGFNQFDFVTCKGDELRLANDDFPENDFYQ